MNRSVRRILNLGPPVWDLCVSSVGCFVFTCGLRRLQLARKDRRRVLLFALPARLERHWQASHSNRLHNLGVVTPDQRRSEMLILIIVLVLVFGLGAGYYGYGRWGTGRCRHRVRHGAGNLAGVLSAGAFPIEKSATLSADRVNSERMVT